MVQFKSFIRHEHVSNFEDFVDVMQQPFTMHTFTNESYQIMRYWDKAPQSCEKNHSILILGQKNPLI